MTAYIVLLFVFLGLSAFFSSSETAFFSLDSMRVETLRRSDAPGAARVAALLQQPTRLLSAILLGNNLVNTAAASLATLIATEIAPGGTAVVAATLTATVLLVLFGEIGPKTFALEHNWAFARFYASALAVWGKLASPVVTILDRVSRALLVLAGRRGESAKSLTQGDLRTAIHLGTETGAVEQQTSAVMLGALSLVDRPVESIMVHRSQIVSASAEETIGAVSARLAEHGYLRMPIYEGDPDNVVGVAHISEISATASAGGIDRPVREVMRPARFEAESSSISHLLDRMKAEGAHMVFVVDELGSLSGAITLEDVLEELVGEIASETGREPEIGEFAASSRAVVDGSSSLDVLSADLGIPLALPGVTTVAGLILRTLRRMPTPGEEIVVAGVRLTVTRADPRRILEVAVEVLGPAGEEPAGPPPQGPAAP